MLTLEQLDAKLAAQTRPRVTMERIQSRIAKTEFIHHGLLTLCVLTLVNGFIVTGESACVDAGNYDPAIGDRIAKDNAVQKIWALEGYALADRLHADWLRSSVVGHSVQCAIPDSYASAP